MERSLTKEDLGLQGLEEEPLDVLDLPQIHTRPSAMTLLDTLSLLSVESRSWEVTPSHTPGYGTPRAFSGANTPLRPKRKVRAEGVPQYLTKIVSSHLGWIADDEDKEKIWDTASVRLSERSGRTARGAFTRSFPVPVLKSKRSQGQENATDEHDYPGIVELQIHEPALTADNLGFKTWASSYVLACKWGILLDRIPALNKCRITRVDADLLLELGAGTGLVGLAAAAVLGTRTMLTDLPLIADNLARNVIDNEAAISRTNGTAEVAVLDWAHPGTISRVSGNGAAPGRDEHTDERNEAECANGLDALVIVAADPIYSMDHPPLLAKAISYHLSRSSDAAVIIGVPLREAYAAERAALRAQLTMIGLKLVFEETAIGLDDWSNGKDDEPSEVECSITVWMWS
ncbi:hypothetical protein K461DRAFT_292164 [Myriangium duriaei CBS 260.36]|uniref:Uncharacterized protein n=1 Tax=Myriangium duriaei CBS 260.36 TaxID=1168546 RepID=A0A9P4MJG4_9PEZI|nr:hypothetical protein K461DRAFT_292164 [Myriangium duriaei CBS 260.36]